MNPGGGLEIELATRQIDLAARRSSGRRPDRGSFVRIHSDEGDQKEKRSTRNGDWQAQVQRYSRRENLTLVLTLYTML
jgi:hypothetical protein